MTDVWFLDVGQGHAAAVLDGGDGAVIDCPQAGVPVVTSLLKAQPGGSTYSLFVTHRDLDHCGGIPALLDLFTIKCVYLNYAYALPPNTHLKTRVKAVLSSIFSKAERDAVPIEHVYAGNTGNVGTVSWVALAPTVYSVGQSTLNDNTNRSSMVIVLTAGARKFLVMGDADQVAVKRLLDDAALDLNVDVLLIPHHGAHLPSLPALLARCQPSHAVIGVGRVNAFGHPSQVTLETIRQHDGCRVMCTQVNQHCEPGTVDDPRCAGSVRFTVGQDTFVVVPNATQHDAVIDGWQTPRCRI